MKKRTASFLGLLLTLALSALAVAQSAYITHEAAKETALAHAGVKAEDAVILRVKLDKDDGSVEYEIEFYAGGREYDYDIDAISGLVTSYDSETDTADMPMGKAQGLMTEEAAKAAAFAHAKVEAGAVTLTQIQLDYDDGRWEYEIEFFIDKMEYEYDVDAVTGEILKSKAEKD